MVSSMKNRLFDKLYLIELYSIDIRSKFNIHEIITKPETKLT